MATTQFTYDQVKSGFNGLIDVNALPARVYGASRRGKWSGKITGTEAKMLGKDASATYPLFLVSVDGGAYTDSSDVGDAGVHTLFTGLADIEHDVTVVMGAIYGTTNGWWLRDQSYLLEVTGSSPSFSVLPYSWSAHSPDLVSSGVTVADLPATYEFSLRRNSTYDNAATSKVMFSTSASELLIILNQQAGELVSFYYSVDGGAYTAAPPSDGNTLRLTGLTGTHTYNLLAGKSTTGSGSEYADISAVMADAPLIKIGARMDQFGDSITHNGGSNPPIDIHATASNLGYLGQTYAISGWTINDLLVNLDEFNLPSLIEANDIAILAIGRNNTNINTDANARLEYAQIITKLLGFGYKQVLCRGLLPEPTNSMTPQNLAIAGIVADYSNSKVFFLDVSSWLGIDFQDGVHPSAIGYQQMIAYGINTFPKYLSPPVAYAGLDKTGIESGAVVTITGTAAAGTGTIASTVWEQTVGGATLSLIGEDTLSLSATAPALAQTTTFKLTVTNSNGVASFDSMTLQNLAFLTPSNYTISFDGLKSKVIKGFKNTAVFVFDFNLNSYLEIKVTVGGEVYSTVTNPSNIYVRNNTQLVLDIGLQTSALDGDIIPLIEADQVMLNGECRKVLESSLKIC